MNGLPPMRSESAPAIGATNIGIAVHGSTRNPASSGVYPCAVWKNWVSRKIDPNIPKYMKSDAAFAAENAAVAEERAAGASAPSPAAPRRRRPRAAARRRRAR